jgi:hypothetical protein
VSKRWHAKNLRGAAALRLKALLAQLNITMIQVLPALNSSSAVAEYSVNSQGYRCEEFDSVDLSQIWLFGCSYAWSWACSQEHSLAHQLAVQTGSSVANFSQPGSSIRYQVDQLSVLLSQALRPQRIAVVWPDTQRWPWYGTQGALQPELSHALWSAHSADDLYCATRARLDIEQFRLLCELVGVPLAELSWSQTVQTAVPRPPHCPTAVDWTFPELDLGWDQRHPGAFSHRIAAEEFVLQWSTQQ